MKVTTTMKLRSGCLMVSNMGVCQPTEYDVISSGIVGNFNFIQDRYPRDFILQNRIRSFALLCLRLGALIGSDKDYLDKFNEVIRRDN